MERVAIALLLGIGVLLMFKSCSLTRELQAADAAANLLRTEELAEDAAAAGWETALVERTNGLTRRLQDATDRNGLLAKEKAELARSAELLGGELRVMVDMYADVVGQIDAQNVVVFASDTSATVPDSVVAHLTDSLLTATVRYRPPADLSIEEYRIRLALTLGVVDAADGRQLVTAMAEDERVGLTFGNVYIEQAAPVAFCSIGQKGKYVGIGAGVLALIQAIKAGVTQ